MKKAEVAKDVLELLRKTRWKPRTFAVIQGYIHKKMAGKVTENTKTLG
jgi:hypothetical protein